MYTYTTKGVCARKINFDIEDNRIKNISFIGGCDGNLKAICSLAEGMEVATVIEKLRGISCDGKPTSCPDQLAKALEGLLGNN